MTVARPLLSVIVVARDEEDRIARCLTAAAFADERLLVDTGSTDRTREVAAAAGASVVERPWRGFGPTKGEALALAAGEWVLLLDADEEITPELRRSIERAIRGDRGVCSDGEGRGGGDGEVCGYEICRRSWFLGRWMRHGGWYPDWILRLVRRDRAAMTLDVVHERLTVRGRIRRLEGELLHHTDRTLAEYLRKMTRYANLGAEALYARGQRAGAVALLVHPPAVFLKRYVVKAGFRDGMHGLVLAVLSAVHVAVKYARLWELSAGERRREP